MFRQPLARSCFSIFCRAVLIALALAASCRADPVVTAPGLDPGLSRASQAGGSLAQAARFRRPDREEMKQFYAEFWRKGWRTAVIPSVPTEYRLDGPSGDLSESRLATLFGDIDGDGRPEWIVGCYFPSAPAPEPGASPVAAPSPRPENYVTAEDDRARLVVFKKDVSGRWRIHWRSPGLGFEFRAPSYNLWEVRNQLDLAESLRPPLALVDIDGDGCLEICYHCWSQADSLGGLPGVYRFDGARWVSVAPQADRFSLRDLNGDGRLEVITGSPYVGFGSGDDDVPRVWRWNGRQYEEASSDFPRFYKDLAARYDAYIRRMEARREEFKKGMWERALHKAASLAG